MESNKNNEKGNTMDHANKLTAIAVLGYGQSDFVDMLIEHNTIYVGGFNDGEEGQEYSNPYSYGSSFWALRELGFHDGNDEACRLQSEAVENVQCD